MMAEQVIIDYATAADLPAMADLLEELFSLEADFVPMRDRHLSGLRLILADPGRGRLFVARSGAQVIGMANVLITVSTALGAHVAILEDVIVAPAFRRQGIGRRLLDTVIDWARKHGLARITLLADGDNGCALAFYERMGFTASSMVVRRFMLSGE
ncbi:MAG: GNAT family N-acetyltransferase [Rhodocyclaceae bacterium]|nr:GNAT family N-acetyltransferase [Rhodocyclaceae bacterium]